MKSERRLAAIMFTDIVGYTRLMGVDSEKALALLRRNRDLQKPLIEKHAGKWIKEIGDGILSQFNSTIDAVHCAIEIQKLAGEHLDAQLRIGIHLGDITMEEGDIYGDGVNVASRLESMAPPRAIYISGSVAKAIRGNPEIRTEYLGEFELHNVDYPVAVHAVQGEGLPPASAAAKGSLPSNQSRKEQRKIPRKAIYVGAAFLLTIAALFFLNQFNHSNSASAISSEKSIAVLPFINESANADNQYFCNGIMTGISDHLAKIPDLRVIPRSSIEPFRNNRLSTKAMGDQLNVIYLVDGSVQRIGDQAVISTQLIHAGDEQQIWSERYEVDLSEVLLVQTNITKAVAAQLEMILAPELESRIEQILTDDVQALDYYLQGNEYLFEANSENIVNDRWQDLLKKAEVSFELALQRDSTFAACITGLANVQYVRDVETSVLKDDYLQSVIDLCTKSIRLNPKISDSYLLRSMTHFRRANMTDAEKDLEQALMLNPNSVAALYHKEGFSRFGHTDFVQEVEVLKEIEKRVSSEDDL
jgi:class 3 adenylate cyclase/TolB-like protein